MSATVTTRTCEDCELLTRRVDALELALRMSVALATSALDDLPEASDDNEVTR